MMPWVLGEREWGANVLEIGPGPGVTTDWLRERVPSLTCVEIDRKLAESLKQRLDGSNVTVVEGDATAMPFPDGSFDSAMCFTMLHHVPSHALQDQLLAEGYRVLKPGGLFTGSDSTPSFRWRLFHLFDTCVPAEPEKFASRLEAAGFVDAQIERRPEYNTFKFLARKHELRGCKPGTSLRPVSCSQPPDTPRPATRFLREVASDYGHAASRSE